MWAWSKIYTCFAHNYVYGTLIFGISGPLVSQIVGDHGPPGSPGCYTYGNTNLSWNELLMVIETKEDPPIAAVVLALPLVLVLVLPIAMVAVMLVLAIVLVLAMVTVLLLVLVRKQEAESL